VSTVAAPARKAGLFEPTGVRLRPTATPLARLDAAAVDDAGAGSITFTLRPRHGADRADPRVLGARPDACRLTQQAAVHHAEVPGAALKPEQRRIEKAATGRDQPDELTGMSSVMRPVSGSAKRMRSSGSDDFSSS
jgi:hypothetical protein